ncbi:MAG: class I SAM-dependent methyltransferase [Bacteroidales bacterium]|jgi:ubiquinone/menaquinone biosynthesis C-methylase UbiE
MTKERTWISIGDFIDLKNKIKLYGLGVIHSIFRFSGQTRSIYKWDNVRPSSDFWIIPAVRRRWNEKCTGNPDVEYEDYVVEKLLSKAENLRMLSVGCGTGSRERKFANHGNFSLIEGIDLAPSKIDEARQYALECDLNKIKYYVGDFRSFAFEPNSYDLILFNSSLHHFNRIDQLIRSRVLPLLKQDGYLIIFEYVGPNRLQWTAEQLEYANRLLREIPDKYRTRLNSNATKTRIYRPGLIRMYLVDPSEAVESQEILPAIHKYLKPIEEKEVGWDILHLLLKDISHNFLFDNTDTKSLLNYLFEREDNYVSKKGRSDGIFGIYKK